MKIVDLLKKESIDLAGYLMVLIKKLPLND